MRKHEWHRRTIRYSGFNYSLRGAYFVTICTRKREWLFGEVKNGEMVENEVGRIVKNEWDQTPEKRHNVDIDEFQIMPNHMHFIVFINDCYSDALYGRGVLQYAPTTKIDGIYPITKLRSPSQTVGAIVRGFKSASTKRINELLDLPGTPVWQRNFYERVIRNESELNAVRKYIVENPLKWESDPDRDVIR